MHPHHLLHPATFQHFRTSVPPSTDGNHNTTQNTNSKPRIWSLADMASKEGGKDSDSHPPSNIHGQNSSPGKVVSPIAARTLHQLHHPYMRPDLYRNFYGNPHDVAVLESYQRQLNASLAANGLSNNLLSKAPFAPLSLAMTNSNNENPMQARANLSAASPASSTSSNAAEKEISIGEKPTAFVASSSKP